MKEKPFAMDARVLRRNPWITALAALPFPFALVLALAGAGPVVPQVLILGAIAFAAAWRRRPFARTVDAKVTVDERELRVGSEIVERSSITSAQLVPALGDRPTLVRVSSKLRPDIDVVVSNEDQAHDLLRELGWDPSQTTATFRCGSLASVRYRLAFFVSLFVGAVLVGVAAAALHMSRFALFPYIGIVFGLALWPGSFTIGVDGVLLRWLHVREFISTKDIQLVTRFEKGSGRNRIRGVSILTSAGKTVEIPFTSEDTIAIVRQRIEEVVALAKRGADVADDALLLSRGDLSVREWLARLRAIGEGATAQLRVAPVMPERLWRVALDPVSPPGARVAAAVALGGSLDDEGRSKLAEAAKATAAPKLRVALEGVVRGASDDEMEVAIAAIEEAK